MTDHEGFLSSRDYIEAFSRTQIVCIDFIITDRQNRVLLGKRLNTPAKGFYFVPGGRVFKGEMLNTAVNRIALSEFGFVPENLKMLGVFDHYYQNDNPLGVDGINGHYVVIAMSGTLGDKQGLLEDINRQHSDVVWLTPEDVVSHENVHPFTKNYMVRKPSNKFNY